MISLLPPASTKLERTLEKAITKRSINPEKIRTLYSPKNCPSELLPWLAYAVGVENWNENWSEEIQRSVIAATPNIRRHHGTVWAVREALKAAGYNDAIIEEGLPSLMRDGSSLYNGVDYHSAGSRWALFSIIADVGEGQPITAAERELLINLIDAAKPLRSMMREIIYKASVEDDLNITAEQRLKLTYATADLMPAGLRRNGQILRDQAIKLPKQQSARNGSFSYNSTNTHDGLEPNHSWSIHGYVRDNEWDSSQLKIKMQLQDKQVIALDRTAMAVRDGTVKRGTGSAYATDCTQIKMTQRLRRFGRITRDGQHCYSSNTITRLTA